MKKFITLLLIIFVVCGCSVETTSTSTTTFTTTDSSGNTTTTTTTNENGVVTTDTVTSSDGDPTGLRAKWHELFTAGAKGQNSNGDHIYFIYDNPEAIELAAIMILSEDKSVLLAYDFGNVLAEDDHYIIEDVEGESVLPFNLPETEVENGFELSFMDGTSAKMQFVELDTIIDDMVSIWEAVNKTE